jgi:lysine biosynthesis protein LysW
MAKTYCPDCGETISINSPREGATITCRDCGTKLEIISIDPFEVDFPLDDGWDDANWDDDNDRW